MEMLNITRNGVPTLAAVLNFCLYPQGFFPQLGITAIVVPGTEIGDVDQDSARFIDNKRISGTITELVVFPDGVGILPWMVPGTDDIGQATAHEMPQHSRVLWPFHGVFGSGPTLDETFGLIDTAEKSAQVLVKVYSMGGMKQTISREELIALGKRFGVTPLASALAL